MRPALEGLCYLTDLAVEGGDDVLSRALVRWAADVDAAALATRAGRPEAAAQLRAHALARVEQVSAIGPRLSAVDALRTVQLPASVHLHEAQRALARGDVLAAAAALDEARGLLGGEDGACRCGTCGGKVDVDGYCDPCACAASSACERLPEAAEEVGEVEVPMSGGCGL